MTIKDFKPGQTVYALSRKRIAKIKENDIERYTVISIGRKYVRAASERTNYPTEFFKNNEDDTYLTENKDWGDRMKLFLSEEAANDDVEADVLRLWLRKATDGCRINHYNLEQLRAVKEILEENDHE